MTILGPINALLPKDRGSRRIASGLSYGSQPRQTLDIYAPRAKTAAPRPVVLFFYGGSWQAGDRREYGFVGRALAALGYVTVVADYRLVPGVEYPAFLDDGALALRWVVENIARFGGDPSRIALMGHSSGAYNAVMVTLDPRYTDADLHRRIRGVVGLSGPYDFFPFDVDITKRVFGAVPDPEATQPVNLVTADAPPMFLGTGLEDPLVYPRNTIALAKKLREADVEVVERHYAKARHALPLMALSIPLRGRIPVLADVAAFLADHLGAVQLKRPAPRVAPAEDRAYTAPAA